MRGEAVRAAFARPIAHRGLHAPGGPVENTLAAAEAAARRGYGIECDVRLSRDGRAMVIHDERLGRLCGLDAAVAELDHQALAGLRLADGSAIPTLAALLRALDGRTPLVIEIKGAGEALCDAVLADVASYRGPVMLESFAPEAVRRCAGAACAVGMVGPSTALDSLSALAGLPRCDFLSWAVDDLAGQVPLPPLPLSTWTVRTREQRERADRAGAQIVFEGFLP